MFQLKIPLSISVPLELFNCIEHCIFDELKSPKLWSFSHLPSNNCLDIFISELQFILYIYGTLLSSLPFS